LLAIATLRHLDIRQSRGLTVAAMTSLRAAKQLEFLDLRHIDWVAPEHLRELRAALPGLRTLLANVDGADPVPAEPDVADPYTLSVVTASAREPRVRVRCAVPLALGDPRSSEFRGC
jgi:hypothetical protein